MDETLSPYQPTWRDRVANLLMGTDYERPSPSRRALVEGLVGSSGLGNTGMSVSDLTPVGGVLGLQEDAQHGNKFGMALNAASLIPGAAVAKAVERVGPAVEKAAPDFAKWFGNSKVIDESGSPLTVWHGTNADKIDSFDPSRIGTKTDPGWLGHGFYFTTDKDTAAAYGKNQLPFNLAINNPFDMKGQNFAKLIEEHGGPRGFSNWLRDNGYDGAKMWSQYMALDPNQIRPVVGPGIN